jgi:hypothetical protein
MVGRGEVEARVQSALSTIKHLRSSRIHVGRRLNWRPDYPHATMLTLCCDPRRPERSTHSSPPPIPSWVVRLHGSLRSLENVLPSAIEWGPTVLSCTPACIPERMDTVRTPPRDVFGRLVQPEEAIDTTTGHALVPTVLWIGKCCRAGGLAVCPRSDLLSRHAPPHRDTGKGNPPPHTHVSTHPSMRCLLLCIAFCVCWVVCAPQA